MKMGFQGDWWTKKCSFKVLGLSCRGKPAPSHLFWGLGSHCMVLLLPSKELWHMHPTLPCTLSKVRVKHSFWEICVLCNATNDGSTEGLVWRCGKDPAQLLHWWLTQPQDCKLLPWGLWLYKTWNYGAQTGLSALRWDPLNGQPQRW